MIVDSVLTAQAEEVAVTIQHYEQTKKGQASQRNLSWQS